MIAQISFRGAELWFVAGWTMLHFLWLGTAAGLAAMVCRLLVRRASADVRYAVALMSLAVLAALPVVIGVWLVAKPQAAEIGDGFVARSGDGVVRAAREMGGIIELNGTSVGPSDATITGAVVIDGGGIALDAASFDMKGWPEAILACVPYLPCLWLVGTPLTFALLATGIVGAERLRRGSRVIDDGPIVEACARLRQTLGVTRRVTLAACERIAAPVLVGILRPIILLPPSALTGWSPDEIEMVLLHELAHVRRWDNLINLVQRLVESLLFFHPAVWLVSGWVRREREACCDAVVVNRTKRPHAYAEMLVALAAQMPRSVLFLPAATSAMAAGPLRGRIRRILQLEDDPMLVSGKSFAVVLGSLLVAGTLAVLYLPAVGQAEESATEITEVAEAEVSETTVEQAVESDNVTEIVADEVRLTSPESEAVIRAFGGQVELHTEAAPSETEILKVILSIPKGNLPERIRELFQAVDVARAEGQQLDIVANGENWDLVVVPQRIDWPTVLGDPPRKERVIADKAWERLGLKLVPASQLETWERDMLGRAGGIKIIGGNVPKGLPLPAFLRQLDGRKVDDFDHLNSLLGGPPALQTKVSAFANGHDYLFDATPPDDQAPTAPVADERLGIAIGDWAAVAIPSPREAEIARRVVKELGLKVVPASEAELEQVRKRGLRGGLKLIDFKYLPQLEGPFILTQIQTKALSTGVVGLDDLERVLDANIAATDDPVLLQGIAKKGEFQYSMRRPKRPSRFPTLEDQRLADLAWKALQLELEPISAEELKQVRAEGFDGGVKVLKSPMTQDGIWNSDILVGLHVWPTNSLKDVADVLNRDDLGELNPLKFYVVRMNRQPGSSGGSSVVSGRVSANIGGGGFGGGRGRRSGSSDFFYYGGATADPNTPAPAQAVAATESVTSQSAGVNKIRLRYDGKRFSEWQTIWKNELSNERRLEAAKALAAFGRAGYGEEAAEAILDVAGEYDFRKSVDSDSPEGKLRVEIVSSLTSGPGFDSSAAFDSIARRYDESPDKWHGLLMKFLSRGPQLDKSVVERVRQLLKHKSGDMRAGALLAVVASDPAAMPATIKAALNDPDPQVIARAMTIIDGEEQRRRSKEAGDIGDASKLPPLEFPLDEFVPLLLRTPVKRDRQGNWTAFTLLSRLSTDTAAQLTDRLIEILKDSSRAADHLTVVRALGVMGDNAAAAVPDLERIFRETQDPRLQAAAAYALDRIGSNRGRGLRYRSQLMNTPAQQPNDDRQNLERQKKREEIERLLEEEQRLTQ